MSLVNRTDETMPIDRRPLSDRLAVFPRPVWLICRPCFSRQAADGPPADPGWVKRRCHWPLRQQLRKLDYVLHEALSSGADTIVSVASCTESQRQVAAVAAKLGLAPSCGLPRPARAADAGIQDPGNAFLNRLFARTFTTCRGRGSQRRHPHARWRSPRKGTGRTSSAGSNALGAVGYATTVAEIEQQAARLGCAPTAIVHCTGSAGTQAGLVAGAAIAMPNTAVVGIDIDAEPARVRADVIAFAREASNLLDAPFDEANVEVVAGHAGPAYGVPHEATIEAIRLAGRLEALALDPVYSGKGLAGLIALIRQGRWRKDEDVVFLHTGGAPALFAYQSALGI